MTFLEKKDYEQAEQDLKKCISLDPQYEKAIRGLNYLDKLKTGK
jgi:Tfp pilus assembly protein PilF